MLRIHEIKLKPEEATDALTHHIKKKLGLPGLELESWKIVKESIDARDKHDIRKVYSVDFQPVRQTGKTAAALTDEILRRGKSRKLKIDIAPDTSYKWVAGVDRSLSAYGDAQRRKKVEEGIAAVERVALAGRPVVAGFGPCGMFAALLLAQMGYRPVVLERGKAMDQRAADVDRFWRDGVLDRESNVQFGEGGAGSFSDGKLTTQIKDERTRKVLEELVEAGGGEELLYRQKPHVGTDVLRTVVVNIRKKIESLGGEIRFQSRLTSVEWQQEEGCQTVSAVGVTGSDGREERLAANAVVLALGHSARDTVRMLFDAGVEMEQKPFSIGVRIEHPQAMVNQAQYGQDWQQHNLGAAEYKLSHRCANGRGVYTFCMCPGGLVIAAASEEGGVVTNGMSYSNRGGSNANSGLLVDVKPEDFGSAHPLAGMEFQRKYEKLAFEAGGRTYKAPAQRLGDFMKRAQDNHAGAEAEPQEMNPGAAGVNQKDVQPAAVAADKPDGGNLSGSVKYPPDQPEPSYRPGVEWTDLSRCLPEFAVAAMREALPYLGRRLRGFDRPDAVLTAVESRSSSPVRIKRDKDFEANVKGLYPAGEGAGYAGGIMSAAVDGIRIAEAIAFKYK